MTQSLTRPRGLFALLAATAVLLALLPSPARAGVSGYATFEGGFVYGEDGMAVFTGPPFEQGCLGQGFPSSEAHLVYPADGTGDRLQARFDSAVMVYDLDALELSDPFELLGMACNAVFNGHPVPQPIATGYGAATTVERCLQPDAECGAPGTVFHGHNWVHATVTDTSGQELKVRAGAKFTVTITEEGVTEDIHRQYVDIR